MKPLSDAQTQILTAAAQHGASLAVAPPGLPVAARNAVFRSLVNAGLLEELPASAEHRDLAWRQEEDGTWIALRVTAAGLQAIGVEPEAATMAQEAPVAMSGPAGGRPGLRDAAAALLVAWDAGQGSPELPAAVQVLRAALARRYDPSRLPRDLPVPFQPREGTKQQAVLALLRRPEGATVAQVMETTGWAQHTVRGFLAGLKKKGHNVEVLERVRQVGAGAQGAKGSYSVYRVAPATAEEQG